VSSFLTPRLDVRDGISQGHPTAAAALDPCEQVGHRRSGGHPGEFRDQELLQRLAGLRSPSLEFGVHVGRKIAYEDVRHAYSLQAVHP
jgi:hypothetical protein